MKNILKFVLSLIIIVFCTNVSFAECYKVLVLPDNIQFDSTNYYIYPDSSTIFASDTINELKKDGRIDTISMTEVRDKLRKNTKISILTKNALKEFKYNYNIPFVDFKAIADCFDTDKILIITSQTDVQNYFLQRTLWDFLNIPGASVINPAYKISTFAALVDVNKEEVIWQNVYHKKIASMENRIVAQNFAPATEQLEHIKAYSSAYLSPDIARTVQAKILNSPMLLKPDGSNVVNVSDTKKKPSGLKFNKKNETKNIFPISDNTILKPKQPQPNKDKGFQPVNDNYGILINDL